MAAFDDFAPHDVYSSGPVLSSQSGALPKSSSVIAVFPRKTALRPLTCGVISLEKPGVIRSPPMRQASFPISTQQMAVDVVEVCYGFHIASKTGIHGTCRVPVCNPQMGN
ncbi:hypothetical protein G5V57_28855 [Nordella sp. HKS 07]|uniref:hypothetical protein n=1 Tax=Nordella sp. HKS 07 TaxID=2712222 RepID=UPI0013E1EB8F|nr:hypothetical protein [Nordella sp. HKS 07]QIG51372.1 hypothetical protein G5V57_28855 [Nordella sp. HKS 07]